MKLVRFLRVMLVAFGMSGTCLLFLFHVIYCLIVFAGGGCQGVFFSFGEKNEKIFVFAAY